MAERLRATSATWYGAAGGVVCAVLMLGPGLAPGYLLFYDMVFVPDLQLSDRVLGVDGSVPRAVPNDLVVAVLSGPIPGWIVQKVLLVAVFVGVGAGMGHLTRSRLGAWSAAVVACWNPYLAERLAIGHWGFLLGYATLPWVAAAAVRCRRGERGGRALLGAALLVAAFTGSTGSVLALAVAIAVVVLPWTAPLTARAADLAWVALVFVLANAPWWWPFLRVGQTFVADPDGVAAFQSRADTPLGTVGSLLTGGGIWNSGVWFAERETWLISGVALVLVLLALASWGMSAGWRRHPAALGMMAVGSLGFLASALSSWPGGDAVIQWVVVEVPGGGLIRDSQKFLALWMIFLAMVVGDGVERLRERGVRAGLGVRVPAGLAVGALLTSVAVLPGALWAANGRWTTTHYPADQLRVASQLERAPDGAVAVFPWTLYRRSEWNDRRVVLDPWQRLLSREVLVNDDLPLSDRVVRGESPDSARVSRALTAGKGVPVLRDLGVRYAVVLTDQPTKPGVPDLRSERVLTSAEDITVYDLGPVRAPSAGADATDYIGFALAGGAILLVGASVIGARWRRT
ncbi:hypothetical protein [Demetria terragena]|uniref:hypothetical protein n=1 Tax=Demetria terragena TaxID=63959 RepID=UPI0003651C95|nr:hypothetical protein [Demetria terragena]